MELVQERKCECVCDSRRKKSCGIWQELTFRIKHFARLLFLTEIFGILFQNFFEGEK